MLPDKKIIAFDVDGTLTASKTLITDSMANLIKELVKKKMVVAIAGGSFKQMLTQFLPPFSNDEAMIPFIHNFTFLPTSGSQRYQYDEVKKEWILTDKESLPGNAKEKAIKLLQEVIDNPIYKIPPNPIGNIIEDRDTQITFTPNGQQAPVVIKLAFDPDRKKREKIKAFLEPQLPEVSILINGTSSIDILSKGFNKAVGLMRFLDKVGLDKSDVIFVGDGIFPGGNDYSVYEAGFDTIAVKNPEETEAILKTWLG
ncbi:HAD-IIB family hydrolase [Candidatus Nomurabacteria bacterium]|nr:HAD-IIB family hydrolase [Candidatus Nomurabacteria bacterium]